jgi:hypothetical protein
MPVRTSTGSLGPCGMLRLSPAAEARHRQPSATGKPGGISVYRMRETSSTYTQRKMVAMGVHAALPRRRGYGDSLAESAVEPELASESVEVDDTK